MHNIYEANTSLSSTFIEEIMEDISMKLQVSKTKDECKTVE